jgi:hypothetical protein
MSTDTLARIAVANAHLAGTSIAPIALPKPKAKRTRKPVQPAWMSKPASASQMRRINAEYRTAGLRPFGTLAAFRSVFPTMADASREYDMLTGKGVVKAA